MTVNVRSKACSDVVHFDIETNYVNYGDQNDKEILVMPLGSKFKHEIPLVQL